MTGTGATGLEALFVGGYATALVVAAAIIDRVARYSHERIHGTKTIGFRFHPHLDAWQCSEGTFLWRQETDEAARIVRYGAKAETCNACQNKPQCTDSDVGRTLVRPLDAWPHSEMARFQRALSLSMIVLAALLCSVEVVRHEEFRVRMAFAAGVVVSIVLVRREWRRVRAVKTALRG